MLIQRIGMNGHFHPLASPVMIDSTAERALATHILLQLRHVFFRGGFF